MEEAEAFGLLTAMKDALDSLMASVGMLLQAASRGAQAGIDLGRVCLRAVLVMCCWRADTVPRDPPPPFELDTWWADSV